ncbi:uncharacterized protein LOC102616178 [Citrus sinensis]|nr:uncharacterized protein LOC18049445 [Citrus x clementina]XP_006493275.2 uncharacterized protein LOC102616178 [Citrus sinensis]
MAIEESQPSLILTSGASGRINALFSLRALKCLIAIVNALILILLAPFRFRGRKGSRRIVPWKSTISGLEQEVLARRSLAIRRVVQDDHENKNIHCLSLRDFSLFVTPRGDTIFTQSWSPASVNVRGVVVLLHGLNEHSGRYNYFAKQLNANGFKVFGMDWIGHGGSDGLHAYVHSLDAAVKDMKLFVEKVLADNPGLPCFCFGHSTGAAIVLKAVLDPKFEANVAGVVLTSPAVGVEPSHPIFVVLAPIVSFLLPRYQISAANKNGMPVSRDPEALVAKYTDPLVYTGSIRVRTGYEILRITTYLQRNLNRLKVPFLLLHGTADTVTDPEASKKLHKYASSADKTMKLYRGFLHDLLSEPESDDIVKDIIDWLSCRVHGQVVQ